ncbi:MAG: class I SAM-dependent methyltransferase [Candidatus Schekmanbacteria bacterium]|nr:class I SAM-dependent methyltransferase [Candidatus Schekmanbacteria bacterium]
MMRAQREAEATLYARPDIYDVAFGYRDVPAELSVHLAWAAAAGLEQPGSVLELAAGPARHAVEAARRGLRAAALDLSAEMCDFARARAAAAGVALAVYRADMIDFDLEQDAPFALALCLLDSAAHILSVADMVRHLRAVRRALIPGGIYIIEQSHPRGVFQPGSTVLTEWTQQDEHLRVTTCWGSPDDYLDPITLVCRNTVTYRIEAPGCEPQTCTDLVATKLWLATEMAAAVELSAAFDIASQHGRYAAGAPFDDDPKSWRMITVLKARS